MHSRRFSWSGLMQAIRECAAIICVAVLIPGNSPLAGAQAQQPATASTPAPAATKLPADQSDSLVAPIALYP